MITFLVKIKIQSGQVDSPTTLGRRLESGLAATKVYAASTAAQGQLVPEWGGDARLSLVFCECVIMGRAFSPHTYTWVGLCVMTLAVMPGPVPSSLDAFISYSFQQPHDHYCTDIIIIPISQTRKVCEDKESSERLGIWAQAQVARRRPGFGPRPADCKSSGSGSIC